MSKKIILIVVRHGKSAHNLGSENAHTFAGDKIDNELAPEGIKNAHDLADKIIKTDRCDIIVSSNLKRSKQTAEIIKDDILKQTGKVLKIIEIPELHEINIGDFAGHTEVEVRRLYPEVAKAFYEGDLLNWSFPNGEDFEQVKSRVDAGIEIIKKKESESFKQVLFCGHGMLNRVLFFVKANGNAGLWKERAYPHDRVEEILL